MQAHHRTLGSISQTTRTRLHSVPAFTGVQSTHWRSHLIACRAEKPGAGNDGISEDVLARLRAAEEEAAKLRQQLAIAQAAKGAPVVDVMETKPKRIDSTDNREVPFSTKSERSAWLSEADVEFFVGSGIGETSTSGGQDPEAAATVQRRLLIGAALAIGAGAFALVPTDALRPKPTKPMFFYVVPVLQAQALLEDCKQLIEDAEWDQLRRVLSSIQGPPNSIRSNMESVVALLEDGAARAKGQQLVSEFSEYLSDMDYNTYFDAIPTRTLTASQNLEFVKFSGTALKEAQKRLSAFLALVPQEALQAAFEVSKQRSGAF